MTEAGIPNLERVSLEEAEEEGVVMEEAVEDRLRSVDRMI